MPAGFRALAFVLTWAAILPAAIAAWAQETTLPPLSAQGPVAEAGFAGHLSAYRDASRALTIEQAIALERAGGFAPQRGAAPNFGYTKDVIWLHLGVVNDSPGTADWRLQFRENFFQLFEVYQVGPDGGVTVIEALDAASPFAARRIPYPELVAGFALPPGDRTEIFVRYWSGGSSEVSMSLHTPDSFAESTTLRTAKNFIYYGAMLFLVAAALIAWAIAGQFVFFAYACNIVSALLFIMHGDGNAFRYLWPGAPQFNAYASILLGAAIIVSAANFARHFLQTYRYHPVLEKALLTTIAVPVAMIAASVVVDHQFIKKYLVLLATLSIAVVVTAGIVAARTRLREVRFYVLAWTGAIISSGLMTARHWLGVEISEDVQFDSMRIVLVLDAAFMGLAILDRINQLKQNREAAMAQSLAEARRSLELSTRLQELERDYALAVRLGQTREQHMADTIHDLRQPLAALQMTVRGVITGRAGVEGTAERVEDAFGYLEGLIGRELEAYRQGHGVPDTPPSPVTPMATMLPRLHQMFEPEAVQKGLSLRYVPSGADLPLPPLDAMRLGSNLVANAIKYTDSGRVLFGIRRHAGGLRFEVHDTGPGMSAEDLAEATGRTVRLNPGAAQDGVGLGLAIVQALAETHGARLERLPRPHGGASIAVWFPPVPPLP